MSEQHPAGEARKRRGLRSAIIALGLIGLAAVLYVMVSSSIKPGDGRASLRSLATGAMVKLQTPAEGTPAPAVAFKGPDGAPATLADFRGKVTVLNLWATWCAPCVKEMPTLAALQAAYPDKVKVVALSNDSAKKTDEAKAFIAKHPPLAFYQDADFAVFPKLSLPAQGYPTTVIYDKGGIMRAYLQGEADWSSPQARAVIDRVLSE